MAWTCAWVSPETGFWLLVAMQIASRAIRFQTRPPGSVGFGSRDELPIVTRPAATSATPTSEPPCASRKVAARDGP
jgi:hypothetical protein